MDEKIHKMDRILVDLADAVETAQLRCDEFNWEGLRLWLLESQKLAGRVLKLLDDGIPDVPMDDEY
jgi:hypothetical protein